MKLEPINYYGFDHDAVNKKFTGGLTFLNTVSIEGSAHAVYKVKIPDKAKGHKKYLLLTYKYIMGMSPQKINKYRIANAIKCLECNKILVSLHVHDYKTCGCPNETMIDGGDCYFKAGAVNLKKIKKLKIDMFTGEIYA